MVEWLPSAAELDAIDKQFGEGAAVFLNVVKMKLEVQRQETQLFKAAI